MNGIKRVIALYNLFSILVGVDIVVELRHQKCSVKVFDGVSVLGTLKQVFVPPAPRSEVDAEVPDVMLQNNKPTIVVGELPFISV